MFVTQDPQNPPRNRGFAFVEYYNNACADYSRQKLASANFKLDGNTPTVTWADPKSTPDHSASAQVISQKLRYTIPIHFAKPCLYKYLALLRFNISLDKLV